MKKDLEFKTIKVSQKGRIVIPSAFQKELGIRNGDKLLLIKKGRKIVLEKRHKKISNADSNLSFFRTISDNSLKKLWLNKEDEIWNQYLKKDKK